MNAARFARIQAMFLQKVTSCCNPGIVTLKFIKTTSENEYEDFTGDGTREVEQEVQLKCFYLRSISDKTRERVGVTQNVTDIVYISPLELKAKYGSSKFPDYVVNSFSGIIVEFVGKRYNLNAIIEMEPMQFGTESICLCYQLNLERPSIVNNDL